MSKTAMNLFGQTYEEISKVFGGSDTKFQLAYPFIDWTWPTPKSGFIDPTAYTYVSRIPQWSAIGESYRPTATDLHSVYRSMLLEAPRLTISPEKQQRLKDADEYITKCQNKKLENERAAYRAWHLATANLPPGVPTPNFKEWMVTSGWNKVIQSDKAALDKATKTKELIVAQQNPQYVEVLNAATPPNVGDIKLKSGYVHCFVAPGQEEVLPNYLIGKSGSDWVAELTRGGGMSVDIQLSNSKSSSALQESWAEGVVTADYKFFSVYSENEWKELDIASEEKSLKVNINIAAVTQVPIAPDSGWYNSGYLKLLQEKGEWNSPFTNDKGEYIDVCVYLRDLVRGVTCLLFPICIMVI